MKSDSRRPRRCVHGKATRHFDGYRRLLYKPHPGRSERYRAPVDAALEGLEHLDETEQSLEEWGYGMTFD